MSRTGKRFPQLRRTANWTFSAISCSTNSSATTVVKVLVENEGPCNLRRYGHMTFSIMTDFSLTLLLSTA